MAGLPPPPTAQSSAPLRTRDPAAPVSTTAVWFGENQRLPPIGYAYWSSHRTLRTLAERLAGQRHQVLRIDYDGTGDSAGDPWDPDRVRAWLATAQRATEQLRDLGARGITLVGVRAGATFALLDAKALGAERVVALAPVVTRRYAKEVRLLSTQVSEDADPLDPPGTRVFAGNVFAALTLSDISRLAVSQLTEPPAGELLPVNDVGSSTTAAARLPARPQHAELQWESQQIVEDVIRIGEHQHVALVTSRHDVDPSLNPGSETHIGPRRAWVEFARSLAARGRRSVRVDFLGWGESPDAGRAPGRPYDACCETDAGATVDGLAAAGYERIVLFGLCASAWIGLRAVLAANVACLIAMPQMHWERGNPVDIDWDRIRARRMDVIKRVERGSRMHVWTAPDVLGHRARVARWLEQLARTGMPIDAAAIGSGSLTQG